MAYDNDTDAEKLLPEYRDLTNQRQYAGFYLSRRQVTVLSICTGLLLLLQILTLGSSLRNQSASSSNNREYNVWKECGNNATEARARGCVYDVMMTGWVKKDCFNKELSDRYLLEGGFRFYSDSEGMQEIPLDVMRLGEHTHMWTNDLHRKSYSIRNALYSWKLEAWDLILKQPNGQENSMHIHRNNIADFLIDRAHCVYVWKLQALALESQAKGKVKLIDSESYTLDHTEHCADILVNSIPSPPYSMNYCEVDFLSCGPYLS